MYERKTFSVPASAGKPETCEQVGHTEPDQRGKCLRCGAAVLPSPQAWRDMHTVAEQARARGMPCE